MVLMLMTTTVKEKLILAVVKTVKKTEFSTVAIRKRERGLISKCSKDSRGFIAEEQNEGVGACMITNRSHKGKRSLATLTKQNLG